MKVEKVWILLPSFIVFFSLSPRAFSDSGSFPCQEAFNRLTKEELIDLGPKWNESAKSLKQIREAIKENDSTISHVATALLKRGFILLNGEPGGAKTLVAKTMLYAELAGMDPKELKAGLKIFTLQMNQLIQEGKIVGVPKVMDYLNGIFEVETKGSLVGPENVLFLIDELEKVSPAVSTKLLSVLAERKALHGNKVFDAFFRAGIATSNATLAEIRESFESKATADAIFDRFGIKHTVGNKIVSDEVYLELSKKKPDLKNLSLYLTELNSLVERVEVPDEVVDKMANAIFQFDILEQRAREGSMGNEERLPHISAQQATRRSLKTLVRDTLRARFLLDQLEKDIPLDQVRFTLKDSDLIHLQTGLVQGGPGSLRLSEDGTKILDDGLLSRYLALPHLSPSERAMMQQIQERRGVLAQVLEDHVLKPSSERPSRSEIKERPKIQYESPKALKDRSLKEAYEITQEGLNALRQFFGEGLDYSLGSVAATAIDRTNVVLFGPPGSAKSMQARLIAHAEQRGRKLHGGDLPTEVFELQLDKQTPEGVLTGFLDHDQKLKTGIDKFKTEGSLASPRNFMGLIDEYGAGHPGTLGQLLSLSNPTERLVMNGSDEKTNLQWMAFTANQQPHEMLDLFGQPQRLEAEDTGRKTGWAMHDRGQRKVFVVNKGMTPEEDAEFLKSQLQSASPPQVTTLFFKLNDLIDKVEISDGVRLMNRKIMQEHQGQMMNFYSQTLKAFMEDPSHQIYPHYYVPPNSGSTRSDLLSERAAKASFIMRQMMEGVPFEKLRTRMDLRDLDLLSLTGRYVTPGSLEMLGDIETGTVQIGEKKRMPIGDGLARLDPSARKFLEFAQKEQDTYISTANRILLEEIQKFRKSIDDFREIFPEIGFMKPLKGK